MAALDWIDGDAGAGHPPQDPFFVFFNWNAAHLPYQPDPSRYVDLYPEPRPIDRMARLKEVSGGWDVLAGSLRLDAADLEALRTLYDAEVAGLDALVGRLADALASRGMLDDTLLIVTSDHGEAFGEHGLIDHLFSMYDTTVRVPLVIRFPPRFPPGTVREELVSLVHVVPTILDVTGVGGERPGIVHRSLARSEREARAFVVAENERPVHGVELMERRHPDFDMEPYDHRLRMIRTDTHKLIWHGGGDLELYHVVEDPLEQDDRTGTDPATREQLRVRLEEWMDRQEGAAPEAELFESRDPRALEQLRALGYIE